MQPFPPPVQIGEISEQELKEYDGSDSKKPLLVEIKGQIFDVSQSRKDTFAFKPSFIFDVLRKAEWVAGTLARTLLELVTSIRGGHGMVYTEFYTVAWMLWCKVLTYKCLCFQAFVRGGLEIHHVYLLDWLSI
ncbi:Membrane steroid-binding protein 2 [Capsicum chinense]|nr:Membrane steroid-binding protein 2 [Capsicum chinense]